MHAISLSGQTDKDGTLTLAVPVGLSEAAVDVVVVVQPRPAASPEARGWPPGYLEKTLGRWQGEFVLENEGESEIRDEL